MGGHRNLEYAFWANEQCFGCALLLFIGGIIGTIPFPGFDGKVTFYGYWWAGIYSIIVGLLIMLIEYPRGKRRKGSVMERSYQQTLAKLVTALGPITRNYFSRFVIYFILAIPACTLVTTFLGGVGIVFGSLVYLVSGIKGEEWRSPTAAGTQTNQKPSNAKYVSEAPSNPPPRRPVNPGAVAESQH